MEKEILVSVLLPSYNHERYIEDAVRSILAQKGVPFELIVIDDGSTDKSVSILKKLSEDFNFKFISRENKGVVATLNELAHLSKGKYLCTFASDDIMAPDRLKTQAFYLEEHTKVPVCFGQCIEMDALGEKNSKVDPRFLKSLPSVSFEELLLGKKGLHGSTEMMRRDVFFELGGFDERFYFEDYPLWLKMSKKHGPLPVLKNVFSFYRIHGKNLHLDYNRIYRETLRILEDYKDEPLYKKAVENHKANWFSLLSHTQKLKAFQNFFYLSSLSWNFIRRIPKLFIPSYFLKY